MWHIGGAPLSLRRGALVGEPVVQFAPAKIVIAESVKTGLAELPERNVSGQHITPIERLAAWRPGLDLATIMLVCETSHLLLSEAGMARCTRSRPHCGLR